MPSTIRNNVEPIASKFMLQVGARLKHMIDVELTQQ